MIVSIIEILINKNFYKFLILFFSIIKDFCIPHVFMIDSKHKVNSIFFRNIINLVLSIIVFFCISIKKSEALPHEWVGVPKSEYGEQLWDRQSIKTFLGQGLKGARTQIWTGDTAIFSRLLYQLSYPGSNLYTLN